jgi:mannose-6-phosphate isomerase-like protein (cupin superfamily)
MKKINIKQQFVNLIALWSPKVIARLNDYEVRIAQVQGDYHWHQHLRSDELFLVIEGELRIDFRDHTVLLKEGELMVVPKATEHKPFAEKPCRILLIESSDTIPTGDEDEKNILENSK